MSLAFAALALFPSQTDIPLFLPDTDDGIARTVFSADGSDLLVAHFASGSVSRINVSQGTAVERIDLGEELIELLLNDAGTEAVALDGVSSRLHKLQPSPLASMGSATLGIGTSFPAQTYFGFQLDANGRTAIAWSSDEVSVVDLGTMTEQRVITLPAEPPSFLLSRRVHLAPDGLSMLVLRDAPASVSAQGFVLERIDVTTGNSLGIVLLPSVDFTTFHNTEGRDLVLMGRDGTGDRILRLNGSTGAVISDTTFQSAGVDRRIFTSPSGDRVLLKDWTSIYSVPLVTGIFDATSPSISIYASQATEQAVSSDLATIVEFDNNFFSQQFSAGEFKVIDTASGVTSTVATGRDRLSPGAFSRLGDRLCLIGAERVRVYDLATASQGALLDTPSGPGPQFDGLYELFLTGDGARGVAVPNLSEHALTLDLETAAITGTIALGRRSISAARQSDVLMLLGHEDGTVTVLDMMLGQVRNSFQITGSVVEIHPDPASTRAWLRTDGVGGNALVLVETSPGAAGELNRIPLAGSARQPNDTKVFRAPTLAIDFAGSRCYALGLDAEVLEGIQIPSGASIFTLSTATGASFNPNAVAGSLELSADGTKLLRGANVPLVEVYDVTSQGLSLAWSFTFENEFFQAPIFSGDGTAVFQNSFRVGPLFPLGTGFTAFDSATGHFRDSISAGALVDDVEVSGSLMALVSSGAGPAQIFRNSFTVASYRSGPFAEKETSDFMTHPGQYFTGPIVLDVPRGKLYRGHSGFFTPGRFIRVVDLFEGRAQPLCTGGPPNATGVQSTLSISGSPVAGDQLTASVSGLAPGGMFGLLIVGDMTTPPMPISGSRGSLCVGGILGRFNGQVQSADAAGTQRYSVNTASIPSGNGVAAVQPGSTWAFQAWHRDTAPGGVATSNTSSATAVTFR